MQVPLPVDATVYFCYIAKYIDHRRGRDSIPGVSSSLLAKAYISNLQTSMTTMLVCDSKLAVGGKFSLVRPSVENCDQLAAEAATGGGCGKGMCLLLRGARKFLLNMHLKMPKNRGASPTSYTMSKVLIAHAQ